MSDCTEPCPVEAALDLVGGKWKVILLYHLLREGTLRFNHLQRLLRTVTQRMLTKQLRELEAHGIIHREVFPGKVPHVEYSLTDFGRSLEPVVRSLETWGRRYGFSKAPPR